MTILGSSWGPPSQPSKMAQNGSLEAFFVTIWAILGVPPSQPSKIAQNDVLGAFFVTILGSSWGPPQPALENG